MKGGGAWRVLLDTDYLIVYIYELAKISKNTFKKIIPLQMDSVIKYFTDSITKKSGSLYFNAGESDKIEYKQSFQLSGEIISRTYLKTICGFANNKGGVMAFGVTPDKFELVGIHEKFENLDNKYFSTTFSDNIDGSFDYNFFTHRIEEKIIGFLFVKEANSKPVILKSNFDNSGEKGIAGDIYYRYPGRTSRISYADLRTLINREVKSEINKILNKVEYIASQGQENIAILNTQNGELNTENSTAKFVLSKEILKDINLIQEGKIVQTDGSPAYVIKGVVEVASERIVEKKVVIHSGDIFESFFTQKCDDPKEYLKELLYKESPYYPLFYYITKANLPVQEAIEFIKNQNEPDIKTGTKNKIINRLNSQVNITKTGKVFSGLKIEDYSFEKLDKDFVAIAARLRLSGNARVVASARSAAFAFLKKQLDIPKSLYKKHPKEIAEAFTHLNQKDIKANDTFYLKALSLLYKEIKHTDTTSKSAFRKAVCYCDEALYK